MDRQTFFCENYDVGYQPSPSSLDTNDQPATETTGDSPLSCDSFPFLLTNSENSTFSDPINDNSYSSRLSPSSWQLGSLGMKKDRSSVIHNLDDQELVDLELEMMKERFSKLLLGEDMSGSGKGVCTAVTISNAITNLYATVFGHDLRLEPLKPEKKALWKREMNCLLSVCDYIVELAATTQRLDDGTIVEVMTSRSRTDICINLPALQKLDTMLLEILDSFQNTEFWYAGQGSLSDNSTRSCAGSFRRVVERKEEKWWLPVPCVRAGGLSEKARKHLRDKRDCANQIHKAANAINSCILADMDIPESYIATIPKSGRACLRDSIYRYMNTAEKFSPHILLECLNITSEHEALELADKIEASMYTWRRKACHEHSVSSWNRVNELVAETDQTDKYYMLAERAATLLFCLKQKYPDLAQTSLDACKIQCNQDVGKAILESYSRVLEGLAFNIVSWIDDVLYADISMRNQDLEKPQVSFKK